MKRGAIAAAALLLAASNARAPGPARLEFVRAAGADGCPDRDAFEATVAARMGSAPWSDTAERLVRIVFEPDGRRLVGRMELLDGAAVLGVRTARSQGRDCHELAESLALAVAIALDPRGLRRAPPPASPVAPPADPAVTPREPR